MEIKTNIKNRAHLSPKPFPSKGNHKQNENTTHRMGENIFKQYTEKELISKIYKQLMWLSIKHKQPT